MKKKANGNSLDKKDFLCVGLGASAGGVRALQEFFAAMPPNSGMAFVVILHLAPKHESALAEILQAQTTMPVIKVSETHKVEPNHIYVIQPKQQLEMVDGVVRPIKNPAREPRGSRAAIDVLFRTLAEAYQKNAVCVVLSGTGSDGTLGLKRVKESNGFAIVQEPEDADYDQMPRNAIATGLADWVLPVRLMPEKLVSFRASSERLHLTNGADADKVAREINAEESLREILTILRAHTGHDFSNYKTPTLVRRIARHLQIHELEDLPTYTEFLRGNDDEIQFLQRNLLINVTNFFRDREAFAALETEVVPKLFSGKTARDTVRVWCAGCASGEEAYSLAMLLAEYADQHSDPPKFQVFATDVDDEAVAQARENSYLKTIEADVAPDRLKRFFLYEGNRYRIKKELRETVLFAPHNILRDPPFSRLDLITCRNVLIYINRETQQRVMEIFHFALNRGGYLFLGTSESAESVPELFEATDKKQRLYQRRAAGGYYALPRMPITGSRQINAPHSVQIGERLKAFSLGETHYKLLENLAPPSALVNQDFDIVYMSESVGRYLRFAGGEPTSNIIKMVVPDLQADVRTALFNAKRDGRSTEFPSVRARIDGAETDINVVVRVVDISERNQVFFLVIFSELGVTANTPPVEQAERAFAAADRDDSMREIVEQLEAELRRARSNLGTTVEQHEAAIEELKATNEELQAINEELRSATEELETSKEESQSVNEELTTVNHELKSKMDEAARVNSDLQNLVASTDIATVFLDRDLRIKRYAPLIERIFNVKDTDIGRPLEHFTHHLKYENLTADATEVLKTLKTVEREIASKNNRHFLTRFAPYRTAEDRIEGVVLNFLDITERRLAEIAVRESEERLTAIVNQAAAGVAQMDTNGVVTFANRKYCEIVGLAEKDLLGRNMRSYTHPDDRGRNRELLERLATTGESFDIEKRYVRPDDSIVWVHNTVSALHDAAGDITSLLAVSVDITNARRAEDRLRESENRLQITVKAAEMGTWDWNLKTDAVIWSEQHFKLFGMQPTAKLMKAQAFIDRLHPDDREQTVARLNEAVENGTTFETEFRIVREDDGETRWMEGYGHVAEKENDRAVRMTGVVSDITRRKANEESVRKSEEHLRLIMESVKDYAVITSDLQGNVVGWNAGAEQIFGFREDEMIGQTADIVFTRADRAVGAPEKERATALEKGRAEDERWHLRKDGSRFFASGVLMQLRDGKIEGFVKIARDMTEKMQAEKGAQEKETLRRMVAAQEDERRRIARDIHDHFGQQLTALRLKLDAAIKVCRDQAVCDEIEEAQKVAVQLDADVDFIAWELRPAALDDLGLRVTLQNFVREWAHHTGVAADFHTTGLSKSNLAFETETNLYRIAQEALNNIYKHARAKNVSVLLERRADKIVLIVEDDGRGFDTENKTNRRKGIGLTGMSERARILGGEFEIESRVDRGTTVYARVPLNTEDE